MAISGNIGQRGGNFGIIKTGPATLTLSGTNSYQGGTTVAEGTLVVTNSAALPAGGSLVVSAGGVFVFDPAATVSTSGATTSAGNDALGMGGSGAAVASAVQPAAAASATVVETPLKWQDRASPTDVTGIAKAHDAVLASFVPGVPSAAATAWLWAAEGVSTANEQQAEKGLAFIHPEPAGLSSQGKPF